MAALDAVSGRWLLAVLVVLLGCGRIGFDYPGGDGGAPDDPDAPAGERIDASESPGDAALAGPDAATGGELVCGDGDTCELECTGGDCDARCGADSTCSLDCPGGDCAITCEAGASCTLTCPGCTVQVSSPQATELRCDDNTCTSR